jgi:hypothetical protein
VSGFGFGFACYFMGSNPLCFLLYGTLWFYFFLVDGFVELRGIMLNIVGRITFFDIKHAHVHGTYPRLVFCQSLVMLTVIA